jgi:hypothetical protein
MRLKVLVHSLQVEHSSLQSAQSSAAKKLGRNRTLSLQWRIHLGLTGISPDLHYKITCGAFLLSHSTHRGARASHWRNVYVDEIPSLLFEYRSTILTQSVAIGLLLYFETMFNWLELATIHV